MNKNVKIVKNKVTSFKNIKSEPKEKKTNANFGVIENPKTIPATDKKYIINYLTQTDAYKFSMGQLYFHKRPNEYAKWEFKLRTKDVHLGYMYDDVVREVKHLCTLRFQNWELEGIHNKMPWLHNDYIEHLEDVQLKEKYISITKNGKDLEIVAYGPQQQVFWFEIYILQIVQHLWFKDEKIDWNVAKSNLANVVKKWNDLLRSGVKFTVSDFGIRRSIDDEWNEYMVSYLRDFCPAFVGTSNVYLAIKCDVKPIGTFAHELYAIYQGLKDIPVALAQVQVLEDWTKEYRGDLGIALSDNFGFNAFLRDFDKYYAKLFDGCRHDSGDPIKWGEMLINHYTKIGIDSRTKTACWSDSLDADRACEIAKHFNGRINIAFGIGTFLSATICGTKKKPLSMVMKVVEVNGKPVVKLSDSIGKTMCHDQKYIDYIKEVYQYKSIDEE